MTRWKKIYGSITNKRYLYTKKRIIVSSANELTRLVLSIRICTNPLEVSPDSDLVGLDILQIYITSTQEVCCWFPNHRVEWE